MSVTTNRAPHTAARKMNAEQRRDRVMELALGGASERQVVRLLQERHGIKVSVATVHRDIQRRFADHIEATRHQTETWRARQNLRIERALTVWWARAIGAGEVEPDGSAMRMVLSLWERQAKLLGLDAPQQVAVAARAQVEISYNHRVTMPANSGEPDAEGTAADPRLRLPGTLHTYDESGWLDEDGGRGSVPVLVTEEDDE